MFIKDGKVLFEDNSRKIVKVTYKDGSRAYMIKEMKKDCSYCKKSVHRDSGKLYMNENIPNLQQPKFFCHSCYVSLMKVVKLIKTRSYNATKRPKTNKTNSCTNQKKVF